MRLMGLKSAAVVASIFLGIWDLNSCSCFFKYINFVIICNIQCLFAEKIKHRMTLKKPYPQGYGY
ncbi:hypothetical protein ACJX0J_020931, partial [Zea mays]